jgi:hypothetical protein
MVSCSLSLWERVRVRAYSGPNSPFFFLRRFKAEKVATTTRRAKALTPTLSHREREIRTNAI